MFPSSIADKQINNGPENNANQATSASGLIALLRGLTITCPSAQIAEPK